MYQQPDPGPPTATPISIYVHVPWCRERCGYCAFFSEPITGASPVSRVITRTLDLLQKRLSVVGNPPVDSIYIGGGTPTILPGADLQRLLDGIFEITNRGPQTEYSCEANPHTVTPRLIEQLYRAGINRISIGVQSFQPRLLTAIRRSCADTTVTNDAIALLAGSTGQQWSLDLIGGILDMSLLEAVDDAERACAVGPDHISLYDLSIEPSTPLERRLQATPRLLNPNRSAEVCAAAREVLRQHGYHRYEISSFSRPGKECRHNLRYWAMQPFIGVGPSAVSCLPDTNGGLIRYSDPADINGFASMKTVWGPAETVDARTAGFESLMMGLRTDRGIDMRTATRDVGDARAEVLEALTANWIDEGLALLVAGERLVMTESGWDRLDACLRDLAWRWSPT